MPVSTYKNLPVSEPNGTQDVNVIQNYSDISTLSSVSASASNVTLLSANTNRKGAIFYNDSTAICYLKFGTTASSTSFTIKMSAGSTMIIDSNPIYRGRVDAIWESATGAMRITELT